MSEINLQKLEKLWNHATKNANVHEASTAALMFTKMIAKHKLKVHLYSGQSPATEQQIKEAIDKAYIQGQMETKEQYKRILEHQRSEIYNEGYRDGMSNSYTKADIDRAYQKGYYAGQKEGSIEKAIPSDINQSSGNNLVTNSGTASTLFIHNGTTSTTSSTIRIGL
tara:strand:+ start:1593 stop:2093 length:501 start_codon:yes stop_codon:yes gene_type:complete